jgi:hypothetical protein
LAAVRVPAQVILTPAEQAVLLCQVRGSAEEEAAPVRALAAALAGKEAPARAVDPVQAAVVATVNPVQVVALAGVADRAKLVDPVQVLREARAGEVGTHLAR